MIEQNKQEIAELKKKLEEMPTVAETTPAAASELMDRTKVGRVVECVLGEFVCTNVVHDL